MIPTNPDDCPACGGLGSEKLGSNGLLKCITPGCDTELYARGERR